MPIHGYAMITKLSCYTNSTAYIDAIERHFWVNNYYDIHNDIPHKALFKPLYDFKVNITQVFSDSIT